MPVHRIAALAFVVTAFLSSGARASAATLTISAGELIGAQGVNVGGSFYDVVFVEGTCASVFDGCDAPSDFPFDGFPSAFAASQALLAQVFLDGPGGLFDSQAELTAGCEPTAQASACFAITPYTIGTFFPHSVVAFNSLATDDVGTFVISADFDTAPLPTFVWARWTPQAVTAVPEPASLLLVGTGAAGLLARIRRRGRTR